MDMVTTKMGENGRLVLPVSFRRALRLEPGSDVLLSLRDGEIRVTTRAAAIERAQSFIRSRIPEGRLLSEELSAERRAEAARE
ncbi:MAG: AbrB/MazE/SpoVT family DNA-binding domain-containing protein [Chloroflexota bacterium]|jgi:AbrB family looped-hinge helix DNA binding protein|nr:AbrB/MazE/SpoVT family DNA-binding domain-containing protein [Chloroflexota bacterium]